MVLPKNFSNLFLDMDAFFASVEQQVQPQLRDKPICIAPYIGSSGCCIAKSYKAKDMGVSTGKLVGEAQKICPGLIVIESRPELYMFYHNQILKVLKNISPFVRVLSVDEFNIKLTGSDQNMEKAIKIAQDIKKAISNNVGDYLTCSIGIGPSYWTAKVASEQKKPNGLTILKLSEIPSFYQSLKLTDLPGINFALEKELKEKNILSPLDFYNSSLTNLSYFLGYPGRVWFYRLRGYETDEVVPKTKSIGHQHVLAPKYRNKTLARKVLAKLAEKCAKRLRKKNLYTSGISICIGYLKSEGFRKNIRIGLTSDSESIRKLALSLFDSSKINIPPFFLGITLFNLVENSSKPISLFPKIEKKSQINSAMDKINDKYGPETIIPGSMFDTDDAAPSRIPFGDPKRLE